MQTFLQPLLVFVLFDFSYIVLFLFIRRFRANISIFDKISCALTSLFSYSDYMHYFGTDGIRNKADTLISADIPYFLGKAVSQKGGKVIVARDVRESSKEIEKQLCKGLLEGSAQIWLTGVLPTPALAYTAQSQKADCAIMITASHNPPEFNGLKVFGKGGRKLSNEEECALDEAIFSLMNNPTDESTAFLYEDLCADTLTEDEILSDLHITPSVKNHRIRIVDGAEFLYAKHIKSMFPRFDGYKIRLDCAYGCFATLAPAVFMSLGAVVCAEHNFRDGEKVNVGCGSTHIEEFARRVKKDEIGFAFDGDGDRVLGVVDGKVYDGDAMLLALSTLYRLQGKLKKRFVVGTILTGTKLQRELAYHNTALIRTDVGDKHILDALNAQGCLLGGEKSGHILMLDRANTGDGLITALSILEVKRTLGSLPKYTPYPMLEFNITAQNPSQTIIGDDFQAKITAVNDLYANSGRLIVRPSGTEPYIRVTYECFVSEYKMIFEDIKRIMTENAN